MKSAFPGEKKRSKGSFSWAAMTLAVIDEITSRWQKKENQTLTNGMPRWRQTSGFSRLNCAMDIQGTASKPRLSTSSTCSSLQKRHGVMKSLIFSRRSRKGRQSPWDPRSSTQARFSFLVGSAREPTVSGSAGAASASSAIDIAAGFGKC